MKDTYYFSHDYNSRTDTKIKKLLAKHGLAGYGLFWCIIEDLYNNANALPLDCESIAFDLRTNEDLVYSVIHDFDLFSIDGKAFGSLSIERRINERNEKSRKAKESANLRWSKYREECERNANAEQTQSDGNAIKERKGKERKGKEEEDTHAIFAKKLLSNKLELEAIESSTRKRVTEQIIKEFNAHLITESKHHSHYSQYMSHLRNWLNKKPESTKEILPPSKKTRLN